MDQRISLVTVAVSDIRRSRAFYVDGLGWQPHFEAPELLMLRAGEHLLFSLWIREEFEQEVGALATGPGVAPVTLAHNVASADEVDAVLDTARRAGAEAVFPAQHRAWGGYSGYFADPDGYRWEIAWEPGQIGQLVVPAAG